MDLSRRQFIKGAGAACAFAFIPGFSLANAIPAVKYDDFPAMDFFNIHTNEKLSIKYRDDKGYIASAFNEIKDFFRDFRTGDQADIDPLVMDRIFGLNRYFGGNNTIELISGYRSPETNAKLSKNGGVAKKSYHMKGMAADIVMPKQHLKDLYDMAKLQNSGGSGLYVKSNFVHIDSGPVRAWGDK